MLDSMWWQGLDAKVGGSGVVQHAGMTLARLLSEKSGLRAGLGTAMARRGFVPLHDRGQVVTDLAVMVADGGEAVSDLAVLRHAPQVFGPVASAPTAHRVLREITPVVLKRIAKARARARRWAWDQITARHGSIPASRIGGGDLGSTVVIRMDATLINVHSDKQGAAPTFKKGYGFHPLTGWCDNTGEFLAVLLRPGNAGSNTAADHIALMDACIDQLPPAYRRDLLFTCDGAGSTQDLVKHLTSFAVGVLRERLSDAPPSALWATLDGGFGQIGCVYTAQGFEYDWNGVIFGPDLVYRNGMLRTFPAASKDPALKKKTVTADQADRLIRNT